MAESARAAELLDNVREGLVRLDRKYQALIQTHLDRRLAGQSRENQMQTLSRDGGRELGPQEKNANRSLALGAAGLGLLGLGQRTALPVTPQKAWVVQGGVELEIPFDRLQVGDLLVLVGRIQVQVEKTGAETAAALGWLITGPSTAAEHRQSHPIAQAIPAAAAARASWRRRASRSPASLGRRSRRARIWGIPWCSWRREKRWSALRPETRSVVQWLKRREFKFYILSGDQEAPTRELADQLGITLLRQYPAGTE